MAHRYGVLRLLAPRVLAVWAVVIAAVIAFVYGAEVLSETFHLRSGPTAWYAVRSVTVAMRDNVTYNTQVVDGPFSSDASCRRDIERHGEKNSIFGMGRNPRIRRYTVYWCRRMLESDARR